jgi:hypothetical protein
MGNDEADAYLRHHGLLESSAAPSTPVDAPAAKAV